MRDKSRVLIILYYWPPAGGPGVQRWLQMVKHLSLSKKIEPIVYTPLNADYPIIDKSLEKEIPENVTVLKTPIQEPYQWIKWMVPTKSAQSGFIPEKEKQSLLQKGMIWVRGNWFIPDARIGWVKPATQFLEYYLQKNPVDWIITTGPPHSLHLIGKNVKDKLNIPWVADFRDPWTGISYHKNLRLNKKAEEKHKSLEKQVLKAADLVITTSAWDAQQFKKIYDREYFVLPNAYDIETLPYRPFTGNEIKICYAGNLESTRNPAIFWQAWGKHFETPIQLDLFGIVNEETLDEVNRNQLQSKVYQHGYVDHEHLKNAYQNADVMMICTFKSEDYNGILPGKLFEYIALQKPIIAFGHPDAHLKDWIVENGLGWYFSEESQVSEWLINGIENVKNWMPPNKEFIDCQHRKERVKELEIILRSYDGES